MTLRTLYQAVSARFGERADPKTWWPVYGRTAPPEVERAITNVLVQNSNWRAVRAAVDRLDEEGLLTARGLADAPVEVTAACIRTTGLQVQKAKCLKALGCAVERLGGERAFCATVTREELLAIPGIGPETADRALLYVCRRLAWPVDTYCFRVLAHHGVIPSVPVTPAEKRRLAAEIKEKVAQEIPPRVDDWQRLHALMQLEGERLRALKGTRSGEGQ